MNADPNYPSPPKRVDEIQAAIERCWQAAETIVNLDRFGLRMFVEFHGIAKYIEQQARLAEDHVSFLRASLPRSEGGILDDADVIRKTDQLVVTKVLRAAKAFEKDLRTMGLSVWADKLARVLNESTGHIDATVDPPGRLSDNVLAFAETLPPSRT